MPTHSIAPNLWAWTLTLENGAVLHVMGSSLASAIAGLTPSPIVGATRGESIDAIRANPDAPILILLQPSQAHIAGPDFTLRARGRGFKPESVIIFNGTKRITTFISSTELTTPIHPPGEPPITEAVGVPVLIDNEGPRSRGADPRGASDTSNTLTFTVLPGTGGAEAAAPAA